MTWLQDWVRTIIILVFFAGFLELLLPSGNMKPTVQVLVGLFVLILLLGPISSLISYIRTEPELVFPRIAETQTMDVLARGEDLKGEQLEQILTQYRFNVEQQVKSLLKLQNENLEVLVVVDIVDQLSQADFGQLRSLEVMIPSQEQEEQTINMEVLAKFLANFYGMEEDKVTVTWIK